ncbi:MAG: type I-B CRISPR-associated protein Cas7/Cst2/DevR [Bacteroidia bacterium]|nr:type I-B CRISPR-associated protein Cas7/Cst2/DevR [Bacteroidia bacterium]
MTRYITATVIYRGHALNRDEKVGGNILSVKKLSLEDGIHTFISRVSLRHHLFQTLLRAHDGKPPWEPAPVEVSGSGDKKVIQFDLDNASILTHAELDLFGYMLTKESRKGSKKGKAAEEKEGTSSETATESSLRRKAVVGITKAVSIAPYGGDLAFYANHDLLERSFLTDPSATPNPYSKEEHYSYYKVSFVIDVLRLGVDEWVGSDLPKAQEAPEQGRIQPTPSGKRFIVHENKRQERLDSVLDAIKGGLFVQSSGELNTLVPHFLAIAFVKVPAPILEPYVYWPPDRPYEGGGFCMPFEPYALNSPWYISKADRGGVYLEGVYQGKLLKTCMEAKQNEIIETWEDLKDRAAEAIKDTQRLIESAIF